MSLGFAVKQSGNKKMGGVAATYVSQISCPVSCPFYHNGCYAEYGMVALQMKTHKLGEYGTPVDAARDEATAIDNLPGNLDLRLHVVGDCRTGPAARIVADASTKYMAKFDKKVWTYTHGWRRVKREDWKEVEVLASCENEKDVKLAHKRGYATAIVVPEFKQDKLYKEGDINILPCPEMTKGIKCVDCRLCMNSEYLRSKEITIGFAVHGSGKNKAKNQLRVIN